MKPIPSISRVGLCAVAALLAAAGLTTTGAQAAAPVVLTFEGVGDQAAVNNFYNGGTDSLGNSGTNYGINFSSNSLALKDSDAGGSGNFANEPSPDTILFFLSGGAATMNVAAGFDTGFSFFYTSQGAASINVYDGLNSSGNILATLTLTGQYNSNCSGDPNGTFCNWTPIGVNFTGIAKSVDFGGAANLVGFDNITLGAADPGGVPEPATWMMLLGGFAMMGAAIRMRRKPIYSLS